ncbi:uncharacterized protein EV420DRAFT_557786 [Desarmillaria tabescens]|uniref:Uncharacterized protein n=1 Tax=Armillaria tabescens TaxID=1929756 RepID=A0AA39N2N8_ARMTA|nr:uncharacterized protein EV420DRAFT_557786 [Desarmillaria tabescens]KAK0455732.1 hypothetical protein EV420DRAFT_557786 [Desarmillaria tabescens]
MFTRLTLFASFAALLAPQVLAHPVFSQREVIARSPAPLDLVSAYTADVSKREIISPEIPARSIDGIITPYNKRQIPVEDPVNSAGGSDTIPYPRQDIPAEVPVRGAGGSVIPYPKRDVPVEGPVDNPDGTTIPYDKRQIPEEQPVKSPGGSVIPYPGPKRDGKIELY